MQPTTRITYSGRFRCCSTSMSKLNLKPGPQSFHGSCYLCIGCYYHAAGIVWDCVKIFLFRVNSSVGWQQVSPILSSVNPSVSHSPAISQIIKTILGLIKVQVEGWKRSAPLPGHCNCTCLE